MGKAQVGLKLLPLRQGTPLSTAHALGEAPPRQTPLSSCCNLTAGSYDYPTDEDWECNRVPIARKCSWDSNLGLLPRSIVRSIDY